MTLDDYRRGCAPNALDTVDASADDHRKTLADVEEYMKHKKKK